MTTFSGLTKNTKIRAKNGGKNAKGKLSADVPADATPETLVRYRSSYSGGERMVKLADVVVEG